MEPEPDNLRTLELSMKKVSAAGKPYDLGLSQGSAESISHPCQFPSTPTTGDLFNVSNRLWQRRIAGEQSPLPRI